MELLGDTIIVLASQVVFFMVGWIFFVKMLFKDYELHHSLVQLIFCINFTLSLTMFELIIFEIVDFLDIGSRYFYYCIFYMLHMCLQIFPLVLCHLLHVVHGDHPHTLLHHLLHPLLQVSYQTPT